MKGGYTHFLYITCYMCIYKTAGDQLHSHITYMSIYIPTYMDTCMSICTQNCISHMKCNVILLCIYCMFRYMQRLYTYICMHMYMHIIYMHIYVYIHIVDARLYMRKYVYTHCGALQSGTYQPMLSVSIIASFADWKHTCVFVQSSYTQAMPVFLLICT